MTLYTSLIVFLIIGGVGFLFLLVSLVIGDLFEALDIDFDAGFDGDGGGGEIGILDSRVVSVFLTAFGFIAAITLQLGLGTLLSAAIGIASGVLFGSLIFAFGYFLHTQQSSSSVTDRDLIGRTAEVVVTIKPAALGQISCRVGEERVEKLARIRDGEEEIKAGETVFIEDFGGDSFIVSSMSKAGVLLD